jgi:hypothetical protein
MEKELEIVLAGVKLTCKHCGHDRFNTRNALLNTKVLTFFETDWLANTAEVFVVRDVVSCIGSCRRIRRRLRKEA